MSTETATQMTEERFWAIVEMADWPARQTEDSDRGKIFLMSRLDRGEVHQLRGIYESLSNDLWLAVGNHLKSTDQVIGVGDDGYGDLVAHVIGLGRAEYEKAMADPQVVVERGRARKFASNFSYILPWPQDYDNTDVTQYVERAERELGECREVLDLPVTDAIKDPARRLIALLELLAKGDWEAFLLTEEEGRAAAEALLNAAKPLRSGYGGPLTNQWGIWNLYSDVRRWLVDYPAARDAVD